MDDRQQADIADRQQMVRAAKELLDRVRAGMATAQDADLLTEILHALS